MNAQQFQVPRLRCLAKQALPNVAHGLLPLALFYAVMWSGGIWPAIFVSMAWSWGTIGVKAARRQRVPGMLVLGAAALTGRTIVAMASDSVFLYFLQPTLAAAALAVAFLISVPAGKPLVIRLIADVMAIPDWFHQHPGVRRFFAHATIMWGSVQLMNAGITGWLLVSQPVEIYLVAKTVVTGALMGSAALISFVWFRRVVRIHRLSEPKPVLALPA